MTPPDHSANSGAKASAAGNLTLRVASAAVLAPVVLVITYAGGWVFITLCVAGAGRILWEWTALTGRRADPRTLVPGLSGFLIAAALIGFGLPEAAAGVLVLEAVLTALAVAAWPSDDDVIAPVGWAAGGVLYAGALLYAPPLLRSDPQWGFTALLFLFATVWATDIFAYFCGRAVGGPLLWPAVSPNKTWSGAVGGLAGGVAGALAVAYASGIGKLGMLGVMALVLSAVAQIGDLFESAVKRHFGAKDAADLIPGHGGLMDRVDGLLFAALAALVIGLVRQGAAAPARGLLLW